MSNAKTISTGTLTAIRRLGQLSLALALLAPMTACDEDPWENPNYSEDLQYRAAAAGFPCQEHVDCEEGLFCQRLACEAEADCSIGDERMACGEHSEEEEQLPPETKEE